MGGLEPNASRLEHQWTVWQQFRTVLLKVSNWRLVLKALVLKEKGTLRLRYIQIEEQVGPNDVRIDLKVVGIGGSDVHYFTEG